MSCSGRRTVLGFILLLVLTIFYGCQKIHSLPSLVRRTPPPLERIEPDKFPFFYDSGDKETLIRALKNQIRYYARLKKPAEYPFGETSISSETILLTLIRFLKILEENNEKNFNQLIKDNFDLYQSTGQRGKGVITFTGYYLPLLDGSLKPDSVYRYPLYRLPDDLTIKTDKLSGIKKAVRIENGKEYTYYTRKEIDQEKVLAGKGYEVAYLKDPLECYLIHVQGSGTVILPDGKTLNLHFAGSNYLPYSSLREEMLKDGLLSPDNASMESISAYFNHRPQKLQRYLNRNKRYTFFNIVEGGIVGSLGVELVPERSIATDRQIFPSGALSYIVTSVPSTSTKKTVPWSQFVLNQDEGGAIKGPHRIDIFWGAGSSAEYIAHHMNHPGELYFLVLKNRID
jgi:membrane-bound lytic murein transglycosylase A